MKSSIARKAISCALVVGLIATGSTFAYAQGSLAPEEVVAASETASWCDVCQMDTEHNELGDCLNAGHQVTPPPTGGEGDNPGGGEGTEPGGEGEITDPAITDPVVTDPVVDETTPTQNTDTPATEEEKRTFPPAYAYTPNAAFVPAHYTQDYATEKLITSVAEQARQIGQKHDIYASVLIAQVVVSGGLEGSILAGDPLAFASTYAGALKENAASYKDAARFLQTRGGEGIDYAARLVEVIETYDLTRYDEPLSYKITGQIYDSSLKNEEGKVVGGMRDLTMDDYAKLESVATTFIGLPYVWGGTSAVSGFDCSGFVQYCYREVLGISLPRTTYSQQHLGAEIPFDQLQFGDILFFDDRGDVNHEGMYLGNGYYIHSTSPGGVQITAMEELSPAFAKRIISFEATATAPVEDETAEGVEVAGGRYSLVVTVGELN